MCPLCLPPNSLLWLRHPDTAAAHELFTVLLQTSFSFMHMIFYSLNSYFKSLKCFASNTSFWTTIPIWPPWRLKCLLTSKLYNNIIWDILLIYSKNYFCSPDSCSLKSFRGSNLSPAFVVLCWRGAKVFHFSSEKVHSWSFRYPLCTYVSVWVYIF